MFDVLIQWELFVMNIIFIVQSKALAGAKSFGSFLYSAVNKAGKTVTEAGAKIKKTVEENVSYNLIKLFWKFILLFFYC